MVTPVLQVVHRVITRHLLGQAGLKAEEADSGAVTLIQRFGSAANLNVHLHCLVLDGVYRCDTEGEPVLSRKLFPRVPVTQSCEARRPIVQIEPPGEAMREGDAKRRANDYGPGIPGRSRWWCGPIRDDSERIVVEQHR